MIADAALALARQIMILPARATRTKRHGIEVLAVIGHQFPGRVGGKTEGIDIVRFGKLSGFAQRSRLIAKERGEEHQGPKRGVEVALSLHGALRHLIQVTTYPCDFERDFPFMHPVMAVVT